MSSYKCPQCGLINWNVSETCKRCATPNPLLFQASPETFQPPAPEAQANQQPYQQQATAYQQQAAQPQQQQYQVGHYPTSQEQNATQPQGLYGQPQYSQPTHDYNAPPPPTVYGGGAGANTGGYGYQQNPYPYQNRGYNRPDAVIPAEAINDLNSAKKMIKTAKITANVLGILSALVTVLMLVLMVFLSGAEATTKGQSQQLVTAKAGLGIMLLLLGFFTLLYFGLAQGIKKKSMGSAVTFLILSILGILGALMTLGSPETGGRGAGMAQLLINGLVLVCAICGVVGVSSFKNLVKRYPNITDFDEA